MAVPLKIKALFLVAGIALLAASSWIFLSEMKFGFAEGMDAYFLAAFLFAALAAAYRAVEARFEPPKEKEGERKHVPEGKLGLAAKKKRREKKLA